MDTASEREALVAWLARPPEASVVETSAALRPISHRVVAWAALAALRALLEDVVGDEATEPSHLERGRLVAEAIEGWLAAPSDEQLNRVRQRAGRAEELWNELSGDTGQPEPILAAATNAGWCVTRPDQLFNLTPALGEPARRLGDERVVAAVRRALSKPAPWSTTS